MPSFDFYPWIVFPQGTVSEPVRQLGISERGKRKSRGTSWDLPRLIPPVLQEVSLMHDHLLPALFLLPSHTTSLPVLPCRDVCVGGWGGSTWRNCSRGLELPQEIQLRTSLPVQWLRLWASTARGTGSIPVWRTKIPHATWQKKRKKKRPPGRLPGGAGEEGRCEGPHQGARFLLRPESYSRPNLAPGFTNSTKGPLPTKDS